MSDLTHTPALPELLCPAGSPDALDAAIEGGADAVYLGGTSFNARMNAQNFDRSALSAAIRRAHAYGVKVYLTLNTLVTDREIPAFLDAAREAYECGADALIVADPGGAAAIHRTMPGLELHASTQMSGHCADMGAELQTLGFSRMVIARETPCADIRAVVKRSPIEVEIFVHGALCVSHSGQCLFSSVVGGRSGNRGECAQPCRLPYSCASCRKEAYPLSLKDLSLAAHIPELIDAGVSSLKIEGRMKSPEYVRDTARIWRKLLDERRAATPEEMRELAAVFSRGGFTDGYFTKTVNRAMLGVRSEENKKDSRAGIPFRGLTRKIPVTLTATIRAGQAMTLTVADAERTVTVAGDVPMPAQNAPLTEEVVRRNLCKLGATAYEAAQCVLTLDEGLMLPLSMLNDLRRRAIAALDDARGAGEKPIPACAPYAPERPAEDRKTRNVARFTKKEQITDAARDYFDAIELPLGEFPAHADGVVLPPVIFDSERDAVREGLHRAKEAGAAYAVAGNLGHFTLAEEAGLPIVGDYRLNLTNGESVRLYESRGVRGMILSPELTLPQIRDVGGDTAVIVYGRLPLMTLEKCVIKEIGGCDVCRTGKAELCDRRGVRFPVLREWEHRNVIYNSIPTSMTDRAEDLKRAGITARYAFFTTETADEVNAVTNAMKFGKPINGNVRRLPK